MNGFLNILKPPGMSSAAVVACIKRLTGEKVGHAGTLDPEASGVLPVMVGRAGRLLNYLPDERKIYVAEVAFSGATDTQDAQGKLTEPGRGCPDEAEFLSVLPEFIGNIEQIPPAYSALKVNGVPMYRAARKGEILSKPARSVNIYSIDYQGKISEDSFLIRVECSRGTYIRTLCHDLGQRLGKPAHMRFLLRTLSAGFGIDDSVTLEELQDRDAVLRHLIPMENAVSHLPVYTVGPENEKQARNGVALETDLFREGECVRVKVRDHFLGIAQKTGDVLKFMAVCLSHEATLD